MPDVPAQMMEFGPVTCAQQVISLKAQADSGENTLVTFGTEERSCAKAGETDFLLGWTAGKMVNGKMASVHLPVPMWKGKLASDSDAVSFGDTLEVAGDGEIRRAESGSGKTIVGKAMEDGTAGQYITFVTTICCPSYTSS